MEGPTRTIFVIFNIQSFYLVLTRGLSSKPPFGVYLALMVKPSNTLIKGNGIW